jgi:hypothetical protein
MKQVVLQTLSFTTKCEQIQIGERRLKILKINTVLKYSSELYMFGWIIRSCEQITKPFRFEYGFRVHAKLSLNLKCFAFRCRMITKYTHEWRLDTHYCDTVQYLMSKVRTWMCFKENVCLEQSLDSVNKVLLIVLGITVLGCWNPINPKTLKPENVILASFDEQYIYLTPRAWPQNPKTLNP